MQPFKGNTICGVCSNVERIMSMQKEKRTCVVHHFLDMRKRMGGSTAHVLGWMKVALAWRGGLSP
jgi:hypothetical protein